MIGILKNKNAVILWISRALSRFGDSLETLALMYLVYDLTGSGLAMGTIMLFSMIPNILVSPIAGVVVDRYNKKIIMFWAEITRAVFIALIPVLMYAGVIEFWHICLVSVIVSIAESFFEPCSGVVFRLIVSKEELPLLNSLSTTTNTIMRMVGYSASAIIMVWIGKEVLFLADAATFLISAIAVLIMNIPKVETKKIEKFNEFITDFVDGLKYLKSNRSIIVLLFSIFIINALGTPVLNFIPILTKSMLKIDARWAGYFLTISSIGGILGSMLYPLLLKTKITLDKMYLLAFIAIGITTILPCYFSSPISGISLFFTIGVISPIISTWSFTEMQTSCDVNFLGRVGAVSNIALLASIPLMAAITGLAVDLLSLSYVFKITAVLFILSGVALWGLMSKVRQVQYIKQENLN